MATYLFLFVAAQGHVNASLPMAAELMARGEKVIYYLPDEFAPAITSIGATFRSYQIQERTPPPQSTLPDVLPIVLLQTYFAEQSLYVLPQVLESIQAEQPDYIIYDAMCLWARIVVEKMRVPAITIRTSFVAHTHFNLYRHHDYTTSNAASNLSRASLVRFSSLARQLSQAYGVQPPSLWSIFTHAGPLNIVFVPPFLHPGAETFDERFLFVGPYFTGAASPTPLTSTPSPLAQLPERDILYMSLGTTELNTRVDLYEACCTAFRDCHQPVVLSYGVSIDRSTLSIPDHFLASPYVSQFDVLARTSVFISHGGLCSVMESLYYGVPMVILPMMEEHAILANIVQDHGAAILLDAETATPAQLQSAVQSILEDAHYRANAQAMQKRIRQCGGYRQAVDSILAFSRSFT